MAGASHPEFQKQGQSVRRLNKIAKFLRPSQGIVRVSESPLRILPYQAPWQQTTAKKRGTVSSNDEFPF